MKKIIIANWKMNPQSAREARQLFDSVKEGIRGVKNVETVICPPFVYLTKVRPLQRSNLCKLGAQNVFWQEKGPFTGEISPAMLKEAGITHVVVGHSERRRWLGETDEMVNKKVKAVLRAGLVPVVCVGESERAVPGEIPPIVEEQIRAGLHGLRRGDFRNGIIAYEPVWAIGTGKPETPDNAIRAALFIRKIVLGLLGKKTAERVRIVYGGSVNSQNAGSFISKDIRGMEGVLVGGASLNAEEFVKIVKSVVG